MGSSRKKRMQMRAWYAQNDIKTVASELISSFRPDVPYRTQVYDAGKRDQQNRTMAKPSYFTQK